MGFWGLGVLGLRAWGFGVWGLEFGSFRGFEAAGLLVLGVKIQIVGFRACSINLNPLSSNLNS